MGDPDWAVFNAHGRVDLLSLVDTRGNEWKFRKVPMDHGTIHNPGRRRELPKPPVLGKFRDNGFGQVMGILGAALALPIFLAWVM